MVPFTLNELRELHATAPPRFEFGNPSNPYQTDVYYFQNGVYAGLDFRFDDVTNYGTVLYVLDSIPVARVHGPHHPMYGRVYFFEGVDVVNMQFFGVHPNKGEILTLEHGVIVTREFDKNHRLHGFVEKRAGGRPLQLESPPRGANQRALASIDPFETHVVFYVPKEKASPKVALTRTFDFEEVCATLLSA